MEIVKLRHRIFPAHDQLWMVTTERLRVQPPCYRILMVDDVKRYHALYEAAITDEFPAQVKFAVNGEEALARLLEPVPYDLLILDLNMPKLGGEETLRRIRSDQAFDGMPVIILTGDSDHETHRRLLDIGADDFVEKGSPPEIFVARLKTQIRHKKTRDRLTRLAVDMDLFAAGVLHDIRNLETSVLTITELTRAALDEQPGPNSTQIVQDLAALGEKAEHLSRYATEIIRMVRETQRSLTLAPLDLLPEITWAATMASPRGKSAPLSVTVTGTLQPVIADRHFLRLALLNLAQNAVKYSRPNVPATLSISQQPGHADLGQGGSSVLHIRDNGQGIPRGELRRVFDPFVRGQSVGLADQASGKPKGFGLGLSLVKKVVTMMGGRVWAELPTDGPGSILCLELPLAEAKDA